MPQIALDAGAGQPSAELARRGVAPATRVHVVVEVPEGAEPPVAGLAQAGGALDRLVEEPGLNSDANLQLAPPPATRG